MTVAQHYSSGGDRVVVASHGLCQGQVPRLSLVADTLHQSTTIAVSVQGSIGQQLSRVSRDYLLANPRPAIVSYFSTFLHFITLGVI